MNFSLAFLLLAAWLTRAQLDPVIAYAPLPPTASGLPVGSEGYRLQSFGGGAYMITDGKFQAMFFVTSQSVIMIDAPPTIGENIMTGIRSVTQLPVSHFVYSHAHADHTGAAYLLATENVTIIAHELTAHELALAPDAHRPAPGRTFRDTYTLQVDNQTLQLDYNGPAHEPGNIYIYAPQQKVLMLIDVVFPGWVPFAGLAKAQNVPAFIQAHDQILEYDFDYFVGGHVNRVGVREDVLLQREYVHDVYNNCREALLLSANPSDATNPISANAIVPPIEAANPGNLWAIFGGYIKHVTHHCANVTTQKWLGKLGAVDVYTFSHAATMVDSLRIDYGVLGPFGVQST